MYVVVVDSREAAVAGRIISDLREVNVECRVEPLEYGDYYVPAGEGGMSFIVERKDALDLINSVRTGRLWEQLRGLASAEDARPIVILEGSLARVERATGWRGAAVTSIVQEVAIDFGVPVIPSPSPRWTALHLYCLARRAQLGGAPRGVRRLRFARSRHADPREAARAVLEGFPGIGPVTADSILRRFGTLLEAVNRFEEWSTVPGVGRSTVERVRSVLLAEYGVGA